MPLVLVSSLLAASTAVDAPSAATSAASAPAELAARLLFAGPGLVDSQGTPAVWPSIQCIDGDIGLLVVAHLDESETSTPAAEPIDDHLTADDRSIRLEELHQVVARGLVREVPHVNVLRHVSISRLTSESVQPVQIANSEAQFSVVVEALSSGPSFRHRSWRRNAQGIVCQA